MLHSRLLRGHRGWAGKLRWHLGARLVRRPALLNAWGAALTVIDAYEAPGDTLLTATVCRHLRQRFPRLAINCITSFPELLRHDPNISTLNGPETYFSVLSWYPDLAGRRDARANILGETFARLGMADYAYEAKVYLTDAERAEGRARLGGRRPVLTFSTHTKEVVKDWPEARWRAALAVLGRDFELVHLGDAREPEFPGVQRFAGTLSLRESLAVLAQARVHVGADSFLMHGANGLGVPSVIVFGGSRTPANLGYAANVNLFAPMTCGPCWLHPSRGEHCAHGIACMERISVEEVVAAVRQLVARPLP